MGKPTSGAKLNVIHPLAKGLVGCWLFNEGDGTHLQDYTGNSHGTLVTGLSASWSSNNKGHVLKTTALDQWINLGPSDQIFRHYDTSTPLKTMTIIHGYKKTESSGLQNGNAFGPRVASTSTSNFLNAQIPSSVASVIWAVGGITSGTHFLTASGSNLDNDVWAFVNGPQRGMEIWQNGVLKNNNTSLNPGWTSTSANFALGKAITDAVGYDGDYGEHNFFFVYNRVLSQEEIQWLSADPFSLFQPRLWYKPAFVDYPSGGLVGGSSAVLEGIKVALGGVTGGGLAQLNVFENLDTELSGGIAAGGEAAIGVTFAEAIASGGVVVGGDANEDFYDIIDDLSGGAVVGGDAHVNHTRLLTSLGGAVVGGDAIQNFFDYENGVGGVVVGGTVTNTTYSSDISTGGVVVGGDATNYVVIVGRGGTVAGGSSIPSVDYYSATAEGVVCGGTANHTMIIAQTGFRNGVRAGGKGVVYKKTKIRTVFTGYGLALKSDNILKDREAAKVEKPVIKKHFNAFDTDTETPVLPEDSFKIQHDSTYCDVEDRCSEGVLPKIVERRQGRFMPPKKGTVVSS